MQSPVFEALKQRYPNARLTVWVAPRGTKILAENNPYIDTVIESPIKLSLHRHLQLVWRLSQPHFDTGIVLSPGQLWKSAAYLYLAGIPHRIGNVYPFRGTPLSSFLLTHAIPEIDSLHDIEQNLRLLEPLGITNYQLPITNYRLDVPKSVQSKAKKILEQLRLADTKVLVGFHAGSAPGFEWKRWPIENFAAVGKALIEKKQAQILIFGGPDERGLKEQLKTQLGERASIINGDLLTTAAIIQHCKLFLSNDSGLMHTAAAVGVSTYGLFGPTDEKKTGPRGPISFIIRAPGTKPVYDTDKNSNLGRSSHQTMSEITSREVVDMIVNSI